MDGNLNIHSQRHKEAGTINTDSRRKSKGFTDQVFCYEVELRHSTILLTENSSLVLLAGMTTTGVHSMFCHKTAAYQNLCRTPRMNEADILLGRSFHRRPHHVIDSYVLPSTYCRCYIRGNDAITLTVEVIMTSRQIVHSLQQSLSDNAQTVPTEGQNQYEVRNAQRRWQHDGNLHG